MDADIRRLREIENALKRANAICKDLREKKKKAEGQLYKSMQNAGVDTYEGYSIKKVQPRIPQKRKPAKAKKSDAINFFREVGFEDPESCYEEFEKTQKIIPKIEDDV